MTAPAPASAAPRATAPATPAAPAVAALLRAAQAEHLLPAEAAPPSTTARPWPVVLLTALGAWLAALPLLGIVGLMLGEVLFSNEAAPYVAGALLLALGLVLLRSDALPVFVEQLAVPLLFTGAGVLGFGLFQHLPYALAAALLCLLALGCAALVDYAWLRTLLGAMAAPLAMVALVPEMDRLGGHPLFALAFWFAPHAALALWLGSLVWQRSGLGTPRGAGRALLLEQLGAGWLPATMATLAWQSGATFLLGGAVGASLLGELGSLMGAEAGPATQAVRGVAAAGSVLLTLAAALRIARAWPGLREAPAAAAVLVLAALAALLPSLGGVLLALAVTATTRRWRLAAACGLAAAWVLGSAYYLLAWPLAAKAAALATSGAMLAALAWWAHRRASLAQAGAPGAATPSPSPRSRRVRLLVGFSAVATLVVANIGIQQKETLIHEGQAVYVPLAPVDPRSLMQGDYMRLRFALPPDAEEATTEDGPTGARPQVVARRDARGVATLLRVRHPGEVLAADELRITLAPKDGHWILVSDAWFFREGEAPRFEQARFGEFRVLPDGTALLVGMADAQLQPIAP